MKEPKLHVIFFDIGGIFLTNGWGHESRKLASEKFNLDYEEVNALHNFIFNIYEIGRITLDDYLDMVIFNHSRNFSREEFKEFIFAQSQELPHMLAWLKKWKRDCKFRIISINNEGKELNDYRIKKFQLHECFDAFISSCEVNMRKPDPGIFRLALGMAQATPEQSIYFDDRVMLANFAQRLGIRSFHHTSFETTKSLLQTL